MHITLKQLSVFRAIYQHHTTVQAAQALCLSQSAVSSALNELEKQLGVAVFERVGRNLVCNEYGRILYPKVVALLEQAEEIGELFQNHHAVLYLGASTTIGNYLLPPVLSAFMRDFPNVRVKVTIGNSREITAGLADMAYDLALVEGQFSHPDIAMTPWQSDELILFAAAHTRRLPDLGKRISLADLSACPLILRESGSGTRITIEQQLLPQIPQAAIGLELGNSEAVKQAVLQDLGIGCLSRHVLAAELASGRLLRIQAAIAPIHRTLWLAQHKQKHLSEVMKAFLQYAQAK